MKISSTGGCALASLCVMRYDSKRTGDPSKNKWSSPPMESRNTKGDTSTLLTSWKGTECLTERKSCRYTARRIGPPECSLTGRKPTAKATTSHPYSVRMWYFFD
ncbi:hypothetical protein EVAR_50938_1 [Eumeta japonica]|uniref:Uncharacterized protein n=1 Tax=Eumeta variegata TaxID=151549 RepID=A0A4C1XDS5_EUMVA|nr:hypothetical protein EVAR_50938_1 [Eumeta japonica]